MLNYNQMALNEVISHINTELLKNRTMKDIEESDFHENKGVIQKRLNRKGYIKVNNQFVAAATKKDNTKNTTTVIQKPGYNNTNKNTTIIQDKEDTTVKNTNILQKENKKAFSTDELEKLQQLLNLDIKVLNKMISEYTTKTTTVSSFQIKDKTTTVTSLRINKELYDLVKSYAKSNEIKIGDIFNEMMLNFIKINKIN